MHSTCVFGPLPKHMGRFYAAICFCGLAAVLVSLIGISSARATPLSARAITALDRPVPRSVTLYKRVDGTWFLGGMTRLQS